jgi:hypothetical protein
MVDANVDFLNERDRRADGFYIHRFDAEGAVVGAGADLFDQAFMLMALAYAERELNGAELFVAAERCFPSAFLSGSHRRSAVERCRSAAVRPASFAAGWLRYRTWRARLRSWHLPIRFNPEPCCDGRADHVAGDPPRLFDQGGTLHRPPQFTYWPVLGVPLHSSHSMLA